MLSRFTIEKIQKTGDLVARSALEKARLFGTSLVVFKNGKVVHETPDEFEKNLNAIIEMKST